MIKKGACAGLINNPKLAAEIIQAVKEGVSKDQKIIIKNNSSFPRKRESRLRNEKEYYWIPGQAGNDKIKARNDNISSFPISVKTRIGFDEINTKDWIGFLLEQKLDAVTIHGRTAKEQSLVPAHWDEIGKAVKLRNQMKVKTLIIGNGDVKVRTDGLIKAEKYGIDGIAIGRGIFHNMWAFSQLSEIGSDPR